MSSIVVDGSTITVLPTTATTMRVHDADVCAGRTCIVHSPTDHHMRGWPLLWRGDRNLFERICRCRVGHPDPDQQAYWRWQCEVGDVADEVSTEDDEFLVPRDPDDHVAAQMVHGCCGCCRPDAAQ